MTRDERLDDDIRTATAVLYRRVTDMLLAAQ